MFRNFVHSNLLIDLQRQEQLLQYSLRLQQSCRPQLSLKAVHGIEGLFQPQNGAVGCVLPTPTTPLQGPQACVLL